MSWPIVDYVRSERIRIPGGGGIFRTSGELVFIAFIAQHKKRTKIVVTRHDFWAQNAFASGAPNPAGGAHSAPPDPLAGFKRPLRGREGWEGKVEGLREGEGREGEKGEGKGSEVVV